LAARERRRYLDALGGETGKADLRLSETPPFPWFTRLGDPHRTSIVHQLHILLDRGVEQRLHVALI
jgi:hypothetical protein